MALVDLTPNAGASPATPTPARIPPEQIPLLENAIIQLRAGIPFAKMYPLGSEQLRRAAQRVLASWTEVLVKIGTVNFSVDKGDTLINGVRLELSPRATMAIRQVQKVLTDANIRGLTFHPGLGEEELAVFMSALTGKDLTGASGQEINRVFRGRGVEHVSVNEVIYVGVGEGDAVVIDSGSSWGGGRTGVDPKAVLRMVGRLVESVNGIPDLLAKGQVRARVAEEIAATDPAMAAEVVANLASHSLAGPESAAQWTPYPARDVRCLYSLGKLCAALGTLAAGAPGAAGVSPAEEKPTGGDARGSLVGQVLEELLAPYRDHPETWAQILPALSPFLLERAPDWVRAATPSAEPQELFEKATGLLQFSPAALLEDAALPRVTAILDELEKQGDASTLQQVLEHLAGGAQVPQTRARRLTVRQLIRLVQRYQDGPCAFDEELEEFSVELARHETDEEVLGGLLQYLAERVATNFARGRLQRAEAQFKQLLDFSENGNGILGDASRLAAQARDGLATVDFIRHLVDEALTDAQARAPAQLILDGLGSKALPHLLTAICGCPDATRRQAMVALIREMGAQEVDWLLNQLGAEKDSQSARRLFDACQVLTALDAFWVQVPRLLRHPELEVRAEVLSWCVQVSDPRCTRALADQAAEERDPNRLGLLLEALGPRGDPVAVASVGALLAREGPDALEAPLQVKVLRCLSQIGDPAVIPYVMPVIQAATGSGFTRMLRRSVTGMEQKVVSKPVFLAALEALGAFPQDPAVVELLTSLRQASDKDVSRTVVAALAGLAARARPHSSPSLPRVDEASLATFTPNEALPLPPQATGPGAGAQPPGHRRQTGIAPKLEDATPQAAEGPAPPALTPPLTGPLPAGGLMELVRQFSSRAGLLLIRTPDGQGSVFLEGGVIKGAAFQGQAGPPALRHLVQAKNATYEFTPGVRAAGTTVDQPVDQMGDLLR